MSTASKDTSTLPVKHKIRCQKTSLKLFRAYTLANNLLAAYVVAEDIFQNPIAVPCDKIRKSIQEPI